VATAYESIERAKSNHISDRQMLQRTLESVESQDVSEAIVKYQTLSTQLQTSYRVTAIMSELSLAFYLR